MMSDLAEELLQVGAKITDQAAAEITRLRAELAAAERERDEAQHTLSDFTAPEMFQRYVREAKAAAYRAEQAETALAAERVRGDGWRTIDSAPKDGTPVFVARDMGQIWGWVRGTAYWTDARGISGWIARGISDPPGELGLGEPTHWQPLPPPPKEGT